MTNAALAYKCVEVAYMKAAFKHPGAIKDRHASQATSWMVPPVFSLFFFTYTLAHVSA